MSDKTAIEWTDTTWNPLRGCSRVSEGCRNCYAERMAARFAGEGQSYEGLARMTEHGPRWTGKVNLIDEKLQEPLRWTRSRKVFVNSMSDLFHPNVPDEWIDRIFAVMALTPQHTYQVLTKRPERMLQWFTSDPDPWKNRIGAIQNHVDTHYARTCPPEKLGKSGRTIVADQWPLPNVWLGVSVENQQVADERIPLLLQTPAAVRFLSMEPLLGPVDMTPHLCRPEWQEKRGGVYGSKHRLVCQQHGEVYPWTSVGNTTGLRYMNIEANAAWLEHRSAHQSLHWVIVGGESGPYARPMHPDWVRSIRDQATAAGVPFFFKQWGEWVPNAQEYGCSRPEINYDRPHTMLDDAPMVKAGKHAAGALIDGREWREWPSGA